jgi:hypothetical protein
VLCALGLFALPVSANAAHRWASADSTLKSGTCDATSPCGLEYAAEGDEVVVAPGTYDLTRGVAGQPRPHLIGHASTALLIAGRARQQRRGGRPPAVG